MQHPLTLRAVVVGALALSACATSPSSARPNGDPLEMCQPGEKPPGGHSFTCDGFTVSWERVEGEQPAALEARAAEITLALRKRLRFSGAVVDGALGEEQLGTDHLRLRSAERPLLDVYRLGGVRGPLVLWCTYPKTSGSETCDRVAAALRSPQQTAYWAPPVPDPTD